MTAIATVTTMIRNFIIPSEVKEKRKEISQKFERIDKERKQNHDDNTLILDDTTTFFENAKATLNGDCNWMENDCGINIKK